MVFHSLWFPVGVLHCLKCLITLQIFSWRMNFFIWQQCLCSGHFHQHFCIQFLPAIWALNSTLETKNAGDRSQKKQQKIALWEQATDEVIYCCQVQWWRKKPCLPDLATAYGENEPSTVARNTNILLCFKSLNVWNSNNLHIKLAATLCIPKVDFMWSGCRVCAYFFRQT